MEKLNLSSKEYSIQATKKLFNLTVSKKSDHQNLISMDAYLLDCYRCSTFIQIADHKNRCSLHVTYKSDQNALSYCIYTKMHNSTKEHHKLLNAKTFITESCNYFKKNKIKIDQINSQYNSGEMYYEQFINYYNQSKDKLIAISHLRPTEIFAGLGFYSKTQNDIMLDDSGIQVTHWKL
jgi:hypothetical protein